MIGYVLQSTFFHVLLPTDKTQMFFPHAFLSFNRSFFPGLVYILRHYDCFHYLRQACYSLDRCRSKGQDDLPYTPLSGYSREKQNQRKCCQADRLSFFPFLSLSVLCCSVSMQSSFFFILNNSDVLLVPVRSHNPLTFFFSFVVS